MFAKLWQEDIDTKSKREEMEEAMKIEKNREMLKVFTLNYYISLLLQYSIGTNITINCYRETKGRDAQFKRAGSTAYGK